MQAVTTINTQEKWFFTVATFEGFGVVFFRQS